MNTKEFLAILSNTMKESMVTKDRTMTSITRIVKTEITKASKDNGIDESDVDFLPVLKSTKKKLIEEIESLEKADKIYPTLETLSKYIDLTEIDIVNRESNGDVTIFFQHHYPLKLNCFPHKRKIIKTIDGMNKFLLGTVIEFTKDNTVIDHTNLL